jgi:hypothetical protein
LFWKHLSLQLQLWGFVINPYDTCVANKIINGSQCTKTWHVDDLKILHGDHNVVSKVIEDIREKFGMGATLTVTHGKVYEYLGMNLNFENPGKVGFSMKQYVETVLEKAPEDMDGEAATPAANHRFDVRGDDAEPLDSE